MSDLFDVNINKVPDADIIAERIFTIISVGAFEREIVQNVLNDWNEEWINYIAESKVGVTDSRSENRRRDNETRLKKRKEMLESLRDGKSPFFRKSGAV